MGHNYPGKAPITLHQIYRFAKSYPSNRIVLAHWGGGLFFFALLKKEVKDVLNNVWFDTAASPYLYTPDSYRIAGNIIGFEKILMKNGRFTGYFISNQKSSYFQSEKFTRILLYVQQHPSSCRLREANEKLALIIFNIRTVKEALIRLEEILG